jgi:hypothetical protein
MESILPPLCGVSGIFQIPMIASGMMKTLDSIMKPEDERSPKTQRISLKQFIDTAFHGMKEKKMNPITRIKGLLFRSGSEWEAISRENITIAALYKRYVLPLAAIGPVASFIGTSLVGVDLPFAGGFRVPVGRGLSSALAGYAVALIGVFLLGLIINALAPAFGGEKNPARALMTAAYASIPAWMAGVFYVLPAMAALALIASLYSLYLLYLGLPVMMKSAREKSLGYTALVAVCALAVFMAMGIVTAAMSGFGGFPAMAGTPESTVNREAPEQIRRLDAEIKAAGNAGEAEAQIKAAAAMLGAPTGGAAPVEPVDHGELKRILPSQLGGMKRDQAESSKVGMAGFTIAKAEGDYSDEEGRDIHLSITDMGSAAGIGMFAGWALMEQSRETEDGYEKTAKVGENPVYERYDASAKQSDYNMLIGQRFIIEASGNGIDMDELRRAVAALDLTKLDALKK